MNNKIRVARAEVRMTQQQLAEAIELSGDGKISAFDAQILAEAKAGLRELTDEQWQALGDLQVSDIIDYILGRF